MSIATSDEQVNKMLTLIKERLAAYTVEETIERLHSYGCEGPTIREFFEGLDTIPEDGEVYDET